MEPANTHILLVDDEPDILEILSYNLTKEGYRISTAQQGEEALEKAKKDPPNLIILDIMMPGINGIETCKKLRKIPQLNHTLITFLTALGDDHTEVTGYDVGADDYITKPVRPKVLVSKVSALLRRANPEKHKKIITVGDLTINKNTYQITKGPETIRFPRKEFELLALLTGTPHKVFSRDEILKNVWGNEVVVGDRTIDVHIRKLREKIGAERIKTIPGIGYKFLE